MYSQTILMYVLCHILQNFLIIYQPFPKQQILDSSKLKEFADDNLNLMKKAESFPKQVENTMGKGEIGRYEQFLLFPPCFQQTCTADT